MYKLAFIMLADLVMVFHSNDALMTSNKTAVSVQPVTESRARSMAGLITSNECKKLNVQLNVTSVSPIITKDSEKNTVGWAALRSDGSYLVMGGVTTDTPLNCIVKHVTPDIQSFDDLWDKVIIGTMKQRYEEAKDKTESSWLYYWCNQE